MANILEGGANPMGSLATEQSMTTAQGETPQQTYTRLLGTLFNEHLDVTLTRVAGRSVPASGFDSEFELPPCWQVKVKKKGFLGTKIEGAKLETTYYKAFGAVGVSPAYTTLIQGVGGAVEIPDEAMVELAQILDSKGTAEERAIKRNVFLQTVLQGVGTVREVGSAR